MKELNLGKEKISKLILAFSIPCVVSMLINSVYNIVDQIFIGKGVGTLGNAATNVIFPLVIIFNATAGLIGNGASANFSLRMGEGKKDEAGKSIGQSLVLTVIVSLVLALCAYVFLPQLIRLFGCTDNVYDYALSYGRIIVLGAPFMIIYSALSNIIRADGSPKYSMIMLVIGAVINIILDPIFIILFDMGVEGGALATVIGQFVSFVIALVYIKRIKSVRLSKESTKLDKNVFKILSLGLSSFITQCTILVLFVFMNNVMTRFGALSKFGEDIPLSVYGVVSKINSLFISTVLGVSIGAQPIIGYNYGAGNELRVKETLKRVLVINFAVGIVFNVLFVAFPRQIAGIFIANTDPNYDLFIEFAVLMCRTFLLVSSLNAMEMTTSIVIQSLGKVKKATAVSFIRQIILLIPISLLLATVFDMGIYGILYAGLISDALCFVVAVFIFRSEYCKLGKFKSEEDIVIEEDNHSDYSSFDKVITVSREYGSGGRYVAELLAEKLGVPCYDSAIIRASAKESGFTEEYVERAEQNRNNFYENDDKLFIAESKVIKKLAQHPCVIVGRCADYILKDKKNVIKVFLYSDVENKVKRAVKYYGLNKKEASKEISKIDKDRSRHYKYYTGRDWRSLDNYEMLLNVDQHGVEKTAEILSSFVQK